MKILFVASIIVSLLRSFNGDKMIIRFTIPDLKKPPALKFPERCVNCGKPKDEMLGLTLNMGVQHRNQPVTLQMKVPMCKACADKERGIAKVTFIPFLIAGFVFGAIAFIPVMLISPQGSDPSTVNAPFVLGGLAGLLVGSIAGTLVEIVVRSMAVPFYGRLITRRPLTVYAMFSETDELLGVSARFLCKKRLVQLEFENEAIAREFSQLNQLENQ